MCSVSHHNQSLTSDHIIIHLWWYLAHIHPSGDLKMWFQTNTHYFAYGLIKAAGDYNLCKLYRILWWHLIVWIIITIPINLHSVLQYYGACHMIYNLTVGTYFRCLITREYLGLVHQLFWAAVTKTYFSERLTTRTPAVSPVWLPRASGS